jgi:N-methylhydantoinase B
MRDPHRVEEDFADGKISAEFARRHYGVVFDGHGKVDADGTARLRSQSRPR